MGDWMVRIPKNGCPHRKHGTPRRKYLICGSVLNKGDGKCTAKNCPYIIKVWE